MRRTLLVGGTASHVGKSTVAAGICRALARNGVDVVPFKAQNMSNNARVAVHPDGGYGEIGVSQHVQAKAAGVPAHVDFNPVLLKPRGDGESQLVIHGRAVGHFEAARYYERYWDEVLAATRESHERLAADHDVVVAEGAGGMGEINLHDRDLANVETARLGDADVVLVADIERGGAFASLCGTLELMPDDVRERVVGTVVTKFRGDRSILEPGIAAVEERTGVPMLGVIPHDDPGLPAEDSVSLPDPGSTAVWGADRSGPTATVAVPRLPRISNFTDLEPLARVPGLAVRFVPPSGAVADADAVVLPGTKNTVDDLLELGAAGFGDRLREFDGPIVGLCGGYQMLGERITGADVEGTGDRKTVEGFGLLPVETHFTEEKRVEHVERHLSGTGPLAGADGRVSGYEIHMGSTTTPGDTTLTRPVGPESAAHGMVLGTYLHGIFENRVAREAFAGSVREAAGIDRPSVGGNRASPYERAADLVVEHLDLEALGLP